MPIIKYFDELNLVKRIDASKSEEEVIIGLSISSFFMI
jgi:hypothetical protein